MEENRASITAENNAAIRAFESIQHPIKRLCNDPFAKFFVSDQLARSDNMPSLIGKLLSEWEIAFPGVCGSIIARTKFIDECLEKVIRDGLEQLVILGAGYDTRALRFDGLKKIVKVYEIDHPGTQEVKLKRLKKYMMFLPEHVTYIPIDFCKENIDKKLFSHGYDKMLKTFFIWEGVTYYLSESAINETLSFIASNSPPGSGLVFDYFPPSVSEGSCELKEAKNLREGLSRLGEEIIFGIVPYEIESFMAERGFHVVKNITSRDYMRSLLKDDIGKRTASDIFFLVYVTVS